MPLRLTVDAKPGKRIPSMWASGDTVIVAVRERAVDGRANRAIEHAIADWLGIEARRVSIVRGLAGRRKQVEISDIDPTVLAGRIDALPRYPER